MSEHYEEINHPPHYNWHPKIECLDVVEHFSFNLGNAIKYLWRAGHKPGVDFEKDLRKATFYIEREIERLKKET